MASNSSIETPHLTGVTSIMAVAFCIGINFVHTYLSKTSKRRATLFGRKLAFWSHLAMFFTSLCPFFILLSYVHPERWFGDENACLCQQWFAYAVISFSTGLFLLKMNYLVRLNMVLNPGSTRKCSTFFSVYLAILTIELIVVNTIQYMVIDGNCSDIGDFGCKTEFSEWNGWLTTGILIHDMALYYLFCVYYIRRVKGALNLKRSGAVDGGSKVAINGGSIDTSDVNGSATNETGHLSDGGDSKLSMNSDSESNRVVERNKLRLKREKRKMELVYNGLIRQFRVTLIAIGICAVDLVCNTIWMDYNMLWLNQFDSCAVVFLNFLAFRDSQYLVMDIFQWCKNFGCESCSLLIDVCCCMKENKTFSDDDTTIKTPHTGDTEAAAADGTAASGDSSSSGQITPDEYEDSFLRYDEENDNGSGNGTDNNTTQATDITAISSD